MKRARFNYTGRAAAVAGALFAAAAGQAFGAGFALQEQSGSGLGNAFAGGAAAAEDASTIYSNPAGMSHLPGTQVAAAGSLICLSAKFHDGGSQPAALQPLGSNGGDAGGCAVVPALYLAVPINRQWAFGLAANVPFGLKTEYDSDWIGRFQAIKSEVKTVNLNPAVSFRLSDSVTIAGGVSWQHINATLTSRINYAGAFAQGVAAGQIPAAIAPTLIGAAAGLESSADVGGNDSAWGWNIGALFDLDPQTRIGLHYRSRIKYNVAGSVSIDNPALGPLPPPLDGVGAAVANGVNAVLASGDVNLALELPETANVSLFRQIDNRWDVMADVQFTGWSSVQELKVVRSTGAVLSTTPENFRDTWRASVGANYHYSPQWMFRAGLAYDQTPVRDAQRTPRLPDSDRTWLAIGAQYRFSPQLVVDAGYTYIIIKDASINQNEGSTAQNGLISGSYRSNVNIGAVQLTYTFD
ncbi:MAG: OmpP1/FadL family transporter [Casimicrobiaceae bacterium]